MQASFVADGSSDINIDDPDFWQKWAEKAKLDLEELATKVRVHDLTPHTPTEHPTTITHPTPTMHHSHTHTHTLTIVSFTHAHIQDSLVIDTPRQRRQVRRYGNENLEEIVDMSEVMDEVMDILPARGRRGWTKLECIKTEKAMLIYG